MYKIPRVEIAKKLEELFELDTLSILDISKDDLHRILSDYKSKHVDFPDCVYKQFGINHKLKILSFDSDFKKIGVDATQEL